MTSSDPKKSKSRSKKRSPKVSEPQKIRGLTGLRLAFCLAYVALGGDSDRGNAGKAYIEAGYSASSGDVASKEGHKLLNIPEVRREIRRLWRVLEAKQIVEISYVVSNLKLLVDVSLKDFINITEEGIVPKNLDEISDEKAKAIKTFKYRKNKDGSVAWEISLHDRTQPLIKLGEYAGAFGELNQALAVMRKYEFDVIRVEGGYFIKDLNAEKPVEKNEGGYFLKDLNDSQSEEEQGAEEEGE